MIPTVFFACVHNAGRSQMAAAFFTAMADAEKVRAISAGTHPSSNVHRNAQGAMNELGFDLSTATSRILTDEIAAGATMLITIGCGEACPVVLGVRRDDWPLEDPKEKPLDRVREIRDEIRSRVSELVRSNGWSK